MNLSGKYAWVARLMATLFGISLPGVIQLLMGRTYAGISFFGALGASFLLEPGLALLAAFLISLASGIDVFLATGD